MTRVSTAWDDSQDPRALVCVRTVIDNTLAIHNELHAAKLLLELEQMARLRERCGLEGVAQRRALEQAAEAEQRVAAPLGHP